MRQVTVTLAIGIALVLAIGALTLTRSPPRVLRIAATAELQLAHTSGDLAACQANEVLPAGVSDIRLFTWAYVGYQVHVRAYRGQRILTEGSRGANWTSGSVTVPVKPLAQSSSGVTICFAIGPNQEPAIVLGAPAPPREAAVLLSGDRPNPSAAGDQVLPGRVALEYLGAGRGTWWSRVASVATHVGFGRAFSGTWIALLIAVLTAGAGALAVALTLRELP